MRRILSLWLPTFATDRARRGLVPPPAADAPLLTRMPDHGRLTVAAVNAAARARRLLPGMGLADARALEPQVTVVDADPEGDAAALERLADWARRYTPWTAVDPSDPPGLGNGPGLLLDITGCAHLLGGEHPLLLDLEGRLAKAGIEARAAIADGIGAAWALARFGAQLVVPPGGAAEALADLPLPALRLGPELVASLRRVGLRRVGELMRLGHGTGKGGRNRAALAARYGAQVSLRLDQALGWVDEPLSPRRPPSRHTARLTVVDPISTPEGLARAVRHLLGQVAASLTAAGEGARSLELEAWRIDAGHDAPPQVLTVGASRPNRDPAHLWRLLEPRMDQLEPGPGFEVMAISVTHAAPFEDGQAVLGGDGLGDLAGPAPGAAAPGGGNPVIADPPVAELVDRLGARLGQDRILRLLPRQSWIPERAVRAVPAEAQDNSPSGAPPASAPPSLGGGAWPADRPRPIRLLPRPEAVEVVAPIPDDPPLLFRWRDQTYRVGRAEGPERLLPEWWEGGERRPDPNPEPRDYYRVEDGEGRRFWLYRLGLYRDGGPPPRWFLHGFFG
ncbi:DNA polymerase Y family protein [Azospirillum sp. B4]|uniref:DNA polymerase Y family protein n=1 Tax=Azospirillum sp. B4 TaxID=95605 RepID=UPI00034C145B|nr:DNA polymerase Y family protein [Azospirillum sp. B4]